MSRAQGALRREVARVARRVHDRGHVVATDGNVSARRPDGRILVTPSGISLGDVGPADLVLVEPDGTVVEGGRPTSELGLHRTCYRVRPDVGAVVHAHPPASVAFSLAGEELPADVLPETVIGLGRPAIARYATPTTPEVGRSVEPLLPGTDAIILARHGSVTVGPDPEAALHALERLEHAALVVYLARQMGPVEPLAPELLDRLKAVRRRYLGEGDEGEAPPSPDPGTTRRRLSPFPPSWPD